jgi:hypothetical protein
MTDPVPPPNNSDISVETNFADAELTGMWPENDRKRVETNTSDIHKNASVAPSSDEESVVAFYDTEKQVRRKKLWRKIKIFTTFALTIVVVVGIMYNLYRSNENNKEQVFSPFSLIFTELDNSDTTHFTHTIRIDGADADFYSLSKIYYFHEQFWPYIYNANEAVVSDPFEIPEGTIIRIPKLDAELIDYKNPSSINKAKNLVNEIMNSSTRQATTNNNDGMVVLE